MSRSFSFELIFIDDGSTDDSWKIIKQLSKESESVKGIRFFKNYGKSQALHIGFLKAKGNVVFTMDADLQDDPEEIPELYDMIINDCTHAILASPLWLCPTGACIGVYWHPECYFTSPRPRGARQQV